jgi:hypothetical protein
MNQKTPCLQMLSWKLHVRMSMSPRKSAFRVFITPSILNKNGGDRLRKTSISSIFEEEILENCRFWKVQTSGFKLSIIYPNYLSCFKVVPEPGQRNWKISCHRIRPPRPFIFIIFLIFSAFSHEKTGTRWFGGGAEDAQAKKYKAYWPSGFPNNKAKTALVVKCPIIAF